MLISQIAGPAVVVWMSSRTASSAVLDDVEMVLMTLSHSFFSSHDLSLASLYLLKQLQKWT